MFKINCLKNFIKEENDYLIITSRLRSLKFPNTPCYIGKLTVGGLWMQIGQRSWKKKLMES